MALRCWRRFVAAPFLIVSARHLTAASIVGRSCSPSRWCCCTCRRRSTHALPAGRAKLVFMKLDHSAIYLFIAGSYTPFALGVLWGAWGWTLFGLVWAMAVTGVLLKAFNRLSHPWLSTGLYLMMGLARADCRRCRCLSVCPRPASPCWWPRPGLHGGGGVLCAGLPLALTRMRSGMAS